MIDTAIKPEQMPQPAMEEPEPYYPSLHLHDIKGIDKIPDKGHLMIKHKVVHRSKSVNKDGKVSHSVEIEVRGIQPHKKPTKDDNAMRELMEQKEE